VLNTREINSTNYAYTVKQVSRINEKHIFNIKNIFLLYTCYKTYSGVTVNVLISPLFAKYFYFLRQVLILFSIYLLKSNPKQ